VIYCEKTGGGRKYAIKVFKVTLIIPRLLCNWILFLSKIFYFLDLNLSSQYYN